MEGYVVLTPAEYADLILAKCKLEEVKTYVSTSKYIIDSEVERMLGVKRMEVEDAGNNN